MHRALVFCGKFLPESIFSTPQVFAIKVSIHPTKDIKVCMPPRIGRFYKLYCSKHCVRFSGIHIDQRHISNMGGWMKSNTSLSSKLGVKVVIFWNFKTILEQFQKMKVVVLTPPNGQYCFC